MDFSFEFSVIKNDGMAISVVAIVICCHILREVGNVSKK